MAMQMTASGQLQRCDALPASTGSPQTSNQGRRKSCLDGVLRVGTPLLAAVAYVTFLVGKIDSARAETPSELFATRSKGSNVVVDHSQWDALLKTYVIAGPDNLNRVDYAKFKTAGHD